MEQENASPESHASTSPENEKSACHSQDSLQWQLMRVMRTLVFRAQPHPALSDLPIMQVRCLHVIRKEEGRKMHDLAEKLEATLPAMSQIVDRLVKRGMVERRADPGDRRVVRLHLTEKAQSALSEARHARDARLEATLSHLSPAEQEQIQDALRLLADATEKATADEAAERGQTAAPPVSESDAPDTLGGGDPLVEMLAQRARAVRNSNNSIQAPAGENGDGEL